jgi:hypothetical protein
MQLQLYTLVPLLTATITAGIISLLALLLLLPCARLFMPPLPLLHGFKPLLDTLPMLLLVLPALLCIAAAVLRPLCINKHKLPQARHNTPTANPSPAISSCPVTTIALLLLLLQVLTHDPAAAVANVSYSFQSLQ